MKRPERFVAERQQTPAAPEPRRGARPAREPKSAAPKSLAPDPAKAPRPARAPAASRPRTARAEVTAADRRRKREERAEVRRFTRSARRRRLGWSRPPRSCVLLAGMVLTAVFSPVLALRTVVVDGTNRLDPAALVDAVDGQLGTPLALLDDDRHPHRARGVHADPQLRHRAGAPGHAGHPCGGARAGRRDPGGGRIPAGRSGGGRHRDDTDPARRFPADRARRRART